MTAARQATSMNAMTDLVTVYILILAVGVLLCVGLWVRSHRRRRAPDAERVTRAPESLNPVTPTAAEPPGEGDPDPAALAQTLDWDEVEAEEKPASPPLGRAR